MKNPPDFLLRDLDHAEDYETWREIALELDHLDGIVTFDRVGAEARALAQAAYAQAKG